MKRFNSVLLRRLLATLLCLATVLSLAVMPISAAKNTDVLEEGIYANISSGTKLYLDPGPWDIDGAWFAAYFFDNSGNKDWVKMTKLDNDTIYKVTVPDGTWENLIFVRMNSSKTALSWDSKWNQTSDLTYTGPDNLCTITGWNESDYKWSARYKDIYFDATLSKLSYAGGLTDYDKNENAFTYADKTMPVADATIYCHWWTSSSFGDVKMTLAPSGTFTDVYKGSIPENATSLLFYSSTTGKIDGLTGACVTVDQDLVTYSIMDMQKPCFYADSSDNTIYTNDDIRREGYWNEAYQLRDVEDGKDADVVDIDAATGAKAQGEYFNATFYDWYTDYELNGRNRDAYTSFGKNYSSHRNWVPFRHLNQALSEYYKNGDVSWPLYVGHFQPDEFNEGNSRDLPFSAIASTLDLYGYAARIEGGNDAYRRFFASNNSHLDAGEGTGKGSMAMQGLVYSKLSENSTPELPELLAENGVAFPLFNQAFIEGANSKNTVLGEVYENVQFPMEVRDYYNTGVAYYVFNSYDTTLKMVETSGTYTLEKVTDETERARYQNMDAGSNPVTKKIINEAGEKNVPVYGFFPFNSGSTPGKASTYNYGFGARFDIEFTLTGDGMVLDRDGNKVPIKFEFSGDDDVWVFIDGKLILDIGGAHSAVTGTIDFSTLTATVNQVKYSGPGTDEYIPCVTSFYMNRGGDHTLTMFYMERGMAESNMELVFNIANSYPATLNVTKEVVDGADPNQVYTMYVTLENAETQEMEPVAVGTEYTVGSETRTVQIAGQLLLKGGETATIVGIPADTEYSVSEESGGNKAYYFSTVSGSTAVSSSLGSISGTLGEATVHTVTVSNISGDQTVVIDYGIPVDVSVENSTSAELLGLYDTTHAAEWTNAKPNVINSKKGNYGTFAVSSDSDGKKITYTPSTMQMTGVDKVCYVVKYTKGSKTCYYYGTLTVVPAATIYYEDDFVDFTGTWKTAGEYQGGNQAEDRPGTGNVNATDANNAYGYDDAYGGSTTHSLGSARYAHVTAATVADGASWPTATFTFTGTAFDLISVTSNKTGFVTCDVYRGDSADGTALHNWVVDTYYGFTTSPSGYIKYTWTYTGGKWRVVTATADEIGIDATTSMPTEPYREGQTVILYKKNYQWTPADPETSNDLYQIPVIKSPPLEYGTYTVVITPMYIPFFDHAKNDGYDFYVDAVRVYAPAKNMESYYLQDGEAYPQYVEFRQPLVDSGDKDRGISIIDGISGGTITEYKEFGPNNEIYLDDSHAVAFTLNASGNIANVHVGAKIFSDNGTLTYTIKNSSGAEMTTGTINLTSHTDMYYDISETYTPVSGDMIILSNTCGTTLTLTTLKITYTSSPSKTATLSINDTQTKSAAIYVNELIGGMIDLETRPLMVSMGHSVSFESDLRLNYRVKLSELEGYDLDSAYLTVEKDVYLAKGEQDVETYVLYPELTSDRMIFNLEGILSVEMGSELRATLHIQDLQSRSYASAVDQYSILAYAKEAFSRCSYEEQPELYRLLIDTLNYGAAAQTYFDRRTDSLVNAGLDAYQQYATKELAAELTASKVVVENANSGLVSKLGFSVSFADRTELNAKLTLAEAAEITAVKVTDAEGNTVATLTEFTELSDGKLQVTYSGIKATQMRQMFYFTAYAGEEVAGATYGYSVEAYARETVAAGLPGLTDLARACMYYGDSAENYFIQRGGESK